MTYTISKYSEFTRITTTARWRASLCRPRCSCHRILEVKVGLFSDTTTSKDNNGTRTFVLFFLASTYFIIIIIIIIIIHARIKVTLSQKCCRGTVQTANVAYICSHSSSYSYNWRSRVRSSLKDALNSSVSICRLNAMYDSAVLTDAGRAFQAHATATGNARSPSVVLREVGTSNVDVDPERSRRRDSTLDVRWSVSARYDGEIAIDRTDSNRTRLWAKPTVRSCVVNFVSPNRTAHRPICTTTLEQKILERQVNGVEPWRQAQRHVFMSSVSPRTANNFFYKI